LTTVRSQEPSWAGYSPPVVVNGLSKPRRAGTTLGNKEGDGDIPRGEGERQTTDGQGQTHSLGLDATALQGVREVVSRTVAAGKEREDSVALYEAIDPEE
jgi:hypothetical protein